MLPKARIPTVVAMFCSPLALVSLAAILGMGCGKRPISNADAGDAGGGLTGAAGTGPAGDGGGGGSVVGNGGRGGFGGGAAGATGVGGGAGTAVGGRGGTGSGATGGTSATGVGGTGGAVGGRGGGAGTGAGTGGRGGAGGSAGTGGSAGSTGGASAGTGGTAAGGRGGSGAGGGTGGSVGGAGGSTAGAGGRGGIGGTGGAVGGTGGAIGGTGGAIGGTGGTTGGRGGAGGRGGGGGTGGSAGTGQPAVVPCPSSAPSGACAFENLTCSYPTGTCFCENGAWTCTACPATQPRPFDSCTLPTRALMNCTYGSVTCSCNDYNVGTSWECGVCPAQSPNTGDRCSANAPFECRYGMDNCVCDGTTWACSGVPQCEGPKPDVYPFTCISPAVYSCAFPAQDQVCACGDANWGTLCSCPAAPPVEGGLCQGPVGGGCDYGDRVCDCLNGRWWCGACPLDAPANGAACSFATNCSYQTGFCYCDGNTWSCS